MSGGMGIYTSFYKAPYMKNAVVITLQTFLSKMQKNVVYMVKN